MILNIKKCEPGSKTLSAIIRSIMPKMVMLLWLWLLVPLSCLPLPGRVEWRSPPCRCMDIV